MDSRALIVVLLAAACAGPNPDVEASSVSVVPGEPGYQRVTLELRNQNGGHGQVELDITLLGSGQPIRASHKVELRAHDNLQVIVDVPASPGTYTARVKSSYPD